MRIHQEKEKTPSASGGHDASERARQLLQALIDEGTHPELHARIRDWFFRHTNEKLNEKAYVEFIEHEIKPNTTPDEYERLKFKELLQKLNIERKETKRPGRLWTKSWRVAAVLLPFVVLSSIIYLKTTENQATGLQLQDACIAEAYEGVQKEIVLTDDTKVWINSGGKLHYPETFQAKREVHLAGEAYFAVTHDREKPFVVHTDRLKVRVLGTSFNVKEKDDATLVTLHSGSVEVVVGKYIRKLSPNQQLTYLHENGKITIENLAALEDWRSDEIYTTNRTLPELFRMIGNYYNVEIVFDEADFISPNNTYNSAFGKGQTAERMIRNLSVLTGRFSYHMENGKIHIEDK